MFANGIAANPPSELRKTSQQFFFFFEDKVIARSHQPEVSHGSFQDTDVRLFSCLLQRAKLNVLFVISLSVAVLTKI